MIYRRYRYVIKWDYNRLRTYCKITKYKIIFIIILETQIPELVGKKNLLFRVPVIRI